MPEKEVPHFFFFQDVIPSSGFLPTLSSSLSLDLLVPLTLYPRLPINTAKPLSSSRQCCQQCLLLKPAPSSPSPSKESRLYSWSPLAPSIHSLASISHYLLRTKDTEPIQHVTSTPGPVSRLHLAFLVACGTATSSLKSFLPLASRTLPWTLSSLLRSLLFLFPTSASS